MKNFRLNLWHWISPFLVMATLGLYCPPTVLAATGDLDITFDSDGKVITSALNFDEARSLAIQQDGKIVVVGSTFDGTTYDFAIARYLPNGTLDVTFDSDGLKTINSAGFDDVATSVAIQQDGKITVAGYAQVSDGGQILGRFAVARLNADGTPDTTFGIGGLTTNTSQSRDEGAHSMLIQASGKIVVGGWRLGSSYEFALTRFNTNGTRDATFGTAGSTTTSFTGVPNARITAIALQSNGKIVAAGEADKGFDIDLALARYNSNGDLDTTFGTAGKTTVDIAVDSFQSLDILAVQSDDKIVVGGYSGSDFALARLTPDGAPDTTFGTNGIITTDFGGSEDVRALGIQSDGKIVAAGATSSDLALARYSSSGTIDNTFGTNGKITTDFGGIDLANALAIQSDGKITLAGSTKSAGFDFLVARYLTNADESQTQVLSAGGTLNMDTELDGATAADPVETALTSPIAGTVTVAETTTSESTTGYTFIGTQVTITAPTGTAASPLVIVFVIDASIIPAGQTKDTIEIFRNGVLVGACTGSPGVASPDPCVSAREDLAGGDVKITVLTSTASSWDIGVPISPLSINPGHACDHAQAPANAGAKAKGEANPNAALNCQ